MFPADNCSVHIVNGSPVNLINTPVTLYTVYAAQGVAEELAGAITETGPTHNCNTLSSVPLTQHGR